MAESTKKVVVKDTGTLRSRIAHLERNPHMSADLNHLDVSGISNMTNVLMDTKRDFVISAWDVSNVVVAEGMFKNSHFNGDISKWNVSKFKNMAGMFEGSKFNNDISAWDVSRVEDMGAMFRACAFRGDISNWNTQNVKSVSALFEYTEFVADLSRWNTSKIETCSTMFMGSTPGAWFSQWTLPRVQSMWNMMDADKKKQMKHVSIYHWFQALEFNKSLPKKEAVHLEQFRHVLAALDFTHEQAANYLHQEWLYAQGLAVRPLEEIVAFPFEVPSAPKNSG